MDFKELIKKIGERVDALKSQVNTEEATKNAFIMPFIKELGYDVFNPFEVVPEFTADLGIKQGEKIDYAIMQDNEPIILIECKHHAASLTINNASQLFRYFHTTKAKFAILTNGIEYKFFTDLVEQNKMDEKPFFSFDITQIKDNQLDELRKFHKSQFDFEKIVNTASDLKYTNELKVLINEELNNPSPDFVKHFAKQIYPSIITQKVLDQFTSLVKNSFNQHFSEIVTNRLQTALNKETTNQEVDTDEEIDSKVITTQIELDGFAIVKAISTAVAPSDKIYYRDAQSYFAILFDDNNRKPICRLYFTDKRLQVGIFDENKSETKTELSKVDDLYLLSESIKNIVKFYNDLEI
ncbi:type I restriction enzyme HsdR N-terminal domain-containing protein [Empedobacter brevis]|uniref:type I restriction enzyme HsdR N-terminal domain-containing protein n=1 Tax=Empedobacter brevis TaxID=247 RepID=UPI0028A97B3E|nr:type I restriction endonuclease [Empedobacter brevis]